MAVAKHQIIEQFLDNNGALLADGSVETYAGGTSTPLATYTDSTAGTPNDNPITLDSAGRCSIWFTKGLAYKVIIKDGDGVTLKSEDNIIIPDVDAQIDALTDYIYFPFFFEGDSSPTASQYLGAIRHAVAVDFGVDWAGAYGYAEDLSTADFAIDVQKNGSSVGTITFVAATAQPTFETTGGATVSFAAGDRMTLHAPSPSDATLNNFYFTLRGTEA